MRPFALALLFALCTCAHAPAPAVVPPAPAPKVHAAQGRVLGPDGAPVAGAVVALNSIDPASERAQSGEQEGLVVTGADGTFAFDGIADGPYVVTAGSAHFAEAMSAPLSVKAGAPAATAELRLSEGGVLLELRLLGERGEPVGDDVRVSRVSDSIGDTFHPVRRADGSFALRLHPGHYLYTSVSTGYEGNGGDLQLEGDLSRTVQQFEAAQDQAPAAPEVVAWLTERAIRLGAAGPGHPVADLEPLLRLVGQARLVNLGEATHGTREFFQLKHRVLELLVTEAGFNTFAIEASWPETLALNDYVHGRTKDAGDLTARMRFWTWDTQEVMALVEWMRAWNADPAHQRKLDFFGFDMQFAPVAAQQLSAWLHRVDPAFAAKYRDPLEQLGSEYRDLVALTLQTRPPELRQAAVDVLAAFDAHREAWVKRSSAQDFAFARHGAEVLVQALDTSSGEFRDQAMARNLEWILSTIPDAKVVGWAHNGHVGYRDTWSMGAHLRRDLGDGVRTLTFAFGEGQFQAMDLSARRGGLIVHQVAPLSAPGALDVTLGRTGLPLAIFDWTTLPKDGPVAAYFAHRHGSRSIGAAFSAERSENFVVSSRPSDADGLIFVAKTTAARANLTGRRSAPANAKAFVNLDLAEGERGWFKPEDLARRFEVSLGRDCAPGVPRCLTLARRKPSIIPGLGTLGQRVAAGTWAGKRVRLSLWAKGAGAHVYASAGSQFGAASAFVDAPVDPKGGPVQLEFDVAPTAEMVSLGLALEGATGEATLGPVSLEPIEPPKG